MPKYMTMRKIIYWLLMLFLFLLPWQSRFVYQPAFLNGGFWEYGSLTWYATEVLLWIIIILSSIDLVRNKKVREIMKTHQGNKKNLIIGLFTIFYLLFSIYHSLNADISFQFVFRLLGAACFFTVILSKAKDLVSRPTDPSVVPLPQDDKLLLALWVGGVIQGLLATWQFLSQKIIHLPFSGIAPRVPQDLGAFVIQVGDQRWLRAYGAFGSPNILGGYLVITFLLGLILYIRRARPLPTLPFLEGEGTLASPPHKEEGTVGRSVALIAGQIIIGLGIVFSFSRAAWVAVEAGIGLIIILVWKNKEQLKKLVWPLGASLVAGVLVASFFAPLFLTRLRSHGRLEQQSLTTRAEQLTDFKKMFKQHPLLGVGPGAYTLALYKQNPNLPVWRYQPVHNIYLLILAELGLAGFGIVFLFSCFLVFWTWKRNRLFLPILILLFALGLFDHWLWSMWAGLTVMSVIIAQGLKNHS